MNNRGRYWLNEVPKVNEERKRRGKFFVKGRKIAEQENARLLSYKAKSFCPLTFGLGYARIATTPRQKKLKIFFKFGYKMLKKSLIEKWGGNIMKAYLIPADYIRDNPFAEKHMYKIYHDGSHYVATRVIRSKGKQPPKRAANTAMDRRTCSKERIQYQT